MLFKKNRASNEKNQEKVANKLIIAIFIQVYIGWGFLYLLKSAVYHLMNNAFLGLISALIAVLPFIWLAYDLAGLYPDHSISTIQSQVFGKTVGLVSAFVPLTAVIFFISLAIRLSHLMIYSYFFKNTPFWLISGIFVAGIAYPALKGIRSIGRLASFTLIPPTFIIIFLELLGLSNINLFNVRPVFTGALNQWGGATIANIIVFIPVTTIFFYLPFLQQPKNILKISFVSLGIVFPLFFLAVFGTVGAFGAGLTLKMAWSVVEFFRIIDYPYLLLEQAGLFFLIAWYSFHFVAISQGIFVVGNELNMIFPRIRRNWFIVGLMILFWLMANIPVNIVFLQDLLKKYQPYFTIFYLGFFILIWLTARARNMGNRKA